VVHGAVTRRVCVLLVLIGPRLHGAFEKLPEGGRAAGMGGVAVAVARDPWTLLANPSLAALLTERSVSAAFSPGLFGIPDLRRRSFAWVEPTQIGTFACAATWLGSSLYRETTASLTYALAVDPCFGCGIRGALYHLRIDRYGSAATFGIDIGLSCAVSPELLFGAAAVNVNFPAIGSCHERLPQELSVGIAYQPLHELILAADLVREKGFPAELRAGVCYSLFECLEVRAGATDAPETYSAGAGLLLSSLRLDYGMTSHPDLGLSHHFALTIFPGEL